MPKAARNVLSALIPFLMLAQEPVPSPTPSPGQPATGAATPDLTRLTANLPAPDPQPYDKVITKDAKTKTGLFTVHDVKEKYY